MEEVKSPKIRVENRTSTTVHNAIQSYNASNFKIFVKTWTKIVLMLGGLFFAILAATGHHLFYQWLDYQEAGSTNWQSWVQRIGNTFMFLVRFFLSCALGIALYEIMWMYARIRTFSIHSLDSMFMLSNSLTDFLSLELMKKAKGVLIVAMIFWLLPIGVLPTTSSIQVTLRWKDRQHCTVRGLDFNQTSPKNEKERVTYLAIPSQGNYTSYTTEAFRIITTVAYSGGIINFASPCPTGQCNYTLNLQGPAVDCQRVDWKSPEAPWYQAEEPQRIFNSENPYIYYRGFAPDGPNGRPNGTFWAAWAYADDDDQEISPNGIPFLDFADKPFVNDQRYTLEAIKCTDYMADYELNVMFKYNVMIMNALSRTLMYPIDYSQQDKKGQWANFAIFELMFRSGNQSTVAGEIIQMGTWNVTSSGKIQNTNLVEEAVDRGTNVIGYFPVRNLGKVIQELYQNVTFSLLSREDLVYATNPSGGCSLYPNTWVYNSNGKIVLWLCYGLSILVTAIVVGFGFIALRSNDPTLEFSFSGILKATRDPELDRLIEQNQGSLEGVKLKLDPKGNRESATVTSRSVDEESPAAMKNAIRYSFLVADSPLSPRLQPDRNSTASGVAPGSPGFPSPGLSSPGLHSPRVTSPLISHHPPPQDTIKEEQH